MAGLGSDGPLLEMCVWVVVVGWTRADGDHQPGGDDGVNKVSFCEGASCFCCRVPTCESLIQLDFEEDKNM